jgi:hypothetical protein
MINAYKISVRKAKGKNHSEDLGVDGMHRGEMAWEGMEWIHLAQDKSSAGLL